MKNNHVDSFHRRLRLRDARVFNILVETLSGEICQSLVDQGFGQGTAEDLTQEAFVTAYLPSDTCPPTADLFLWLYGLAVEAASRQSPKL